jgi:hypothetical protein
MWLTRTEWFLRSAEGPREPKRIPIPSYREAEIAHLAIIHPDRSPQDELSPVKANLMGARSLPAYIWLKGSEHWDPDNNRARPIRAGRPGQGALAQALTDPA